MGVNKARPDLQLHVQKTSLTQKNHGRQDNKVTPTFPMYPLYTMFLEKYLIIYQILMGSLLGSLHQSLQLPANLAHALKDAGFLLGK